MKLPKPRTSCVRGRKIHTHFCQERRKGQKKKKKKRRRKGGREGRKEGEERKREAKKRKPFVGFGRADFLTQVRILRMPKPNHLPQDNILQITATSLISSLRSPFLLLLLLSPPPPPLIESAVNSASSCLCLCGCNV